MPVELYCPYCTSLLTVREDLPDDEAVTMQCASCDGVFEYISGFGVLPTTYKNERVQVQRGPFGPRIIQGGLCPKATQMGATSDARIRCLACICIVGVLIPFVLGLFIILLLP